MLSKLVVSSYSIVNLMCKGIMQLALKSPKRLAPRDSAVDHMRKHLLVIVNVVAIFLFLVCPTQLVVVNCDRVKCQLADGLLKRM